MLHLLDIHNDLNEKEIMLDSYHIYDGGHIQVHKNIGKRAPGQRPHVGRLNVLVQAEMFKKCLISCSMFYITAVFNSRNPHCANETFDYNTYQNILLCSGPKISTRQALNASKHLRWVRSTIILLRGAE